MKNSFYALLLLTIALIACENSDDIDLLNYVLSSEIQYIHSSNGIDTVTYYYTYKQGKLVKMEAYTPDDDKPSITQEFFYDENKRLLRLHAVSYSRIDKSKIQEGFYSYVYNENGKIVSEITDSIKQYFVGPITLINPQQEDYQYDEQHRLISIHTHSSKADFGVFRFYYDSESNLIKEEHYSEVNDTTPSYKIEFNSFDTHPNPFYTFMQTINIPYHNVGYRYSPFNVLKDKSFLFINSQETTNTYEYEYGTTHDLPLKIYRNGKLHMN